MDVAAEVSACVVRERRAIRKALLMAGRDPKTGVLPPEEVQRIQRVLDGAQHDIEELSGLGAAAPARPPIPERGSDLDTALTNASKTLSIIEALRHKLEDPTDVSPDRAARTLGSLGASISGSAQLKPGHILQAMTLEGTDAVVGVISSKLLPRVTFAPVTEYRGSAVVAQRSKGGYQDHPDLLATRRLAHKIAEDHALRAVPVVLSGRGRWVWSSFPDDELDGQVLAYDAAAIIDGRVRVGAMSLAAVESESEFQVPFVLFPSLDLTAEQRLHAELRIKDDKGGGGSDGTTIRRPSQAPPPRLVVGEYAIDVEVTSEPYIVIGPYGYSPLLEVVVTRTGQLHGLYASARSLASQLEEVRPPNGSLIGLRLSIRRESSERTAGYLVEPL